MATSYVPTYIHNMYVGIHPLVMVMVMVTFATASVFALVLDRNPLLCNRTVCRIGILSALVTNGLPPL